MRLLDFDDFPSFLVRIWSLASQYMCISASLRGRGVRMDWRLFVRWCSGLVDDYDFTSVFMIPFLVYCF